MEDAATDRLIALGLKRVFSDDAFKANSNPYDHLEWETRTARITDAKGDTIFEQKDVETPKAWSQTAVNIVASKYFHGKLGSPTRERGVRDLIHRVVDAITESGDKQGYFKEEGERELFRDELATLMLTQRASFNSPVWFNVGCQVLEPTAEAANWHWNFTTKKIVRAIVGYTRPQCSACFINSVGDSMEEIMALASTEALLFKFGSGTGTNFSSLRSSQESVSGGGIASGPLSFMKGLDAFAGVIKSGGKTRRAAKMAILNVSHPDIADFIRCKLKEEQKAYALMREGYDGSSGPDSEAYASIFYQNANNSVRVTDEFMAAVEADANWDLIGVKDNQVYGNVPARHLMRLIAEAAWACGDPGMQYDTTINEWHTVPNSGRINASNPCLRRGSRLLTSKGWKKVEDLALETEIQIYDGVGFSPGRVWKTGRKPIVKVSTLSGRLWEGTEDHQLYTLAEGWKPASSLLNCVLPVTTKPISIQGESQLPKCITGGSGKYYSSYTEELMEALGFLQGDGGFNASSGTVSLYWTLEKDQEFILTTILPLLSDLAANPGEAYAPGVLSGKRSGVCFSRKKLYSWLNAIGFQTKVLPERNLPDFVWKLKESSRASFLRGLFAANGNVLKDARNAVVLVSSNPAMLREVQLLMDILGIRSAVRSHNKEQEIEWSNGTYTSRPSFHLEITHADAIIDFHRLIGFPQKVQQEKLGAIAIPIRVGKTSSINERTEGVRVNSVEYTGEEDDVYDFSCPTTNMGVANGLVVHNCSEYMHLDDSACNLSSLNLMKFMRKNGSFNVEDFRAAVDVMIVAQDILVDMSGYPTEKIARNSHDYRPLGLGYANLGAMLMALGIPYNSDEGRGVAACVTAIMCGEAYAQSARIAGAMKSLASATGLKAGDTGACPGFHSNKEAFLNVINKHWKAASAITGAEEDLVKAAASCWALAHNLGSNFGYRNAQATVLAPTGTIGFMMDCDTTGVEPELALVKYKKLVGGGLIKIVNETVPKALHRLGYRDKLLEGIIAYVDEHGTVEGSAVAEHHLPVFDTSFKPSEGTRSIHYSGHLRMMAAVQPFLSGAISKTINMPEASSVEEITQAYMDGWKLKLKSVAIYRDGSKKNQVLVSQKDSRIPLILPVQEDMSGPPRAVRHRLPDDRQSHTHKFSIAGHDGYLHVGLYPNGQPGEIFIKMAKEGSTISGLMDGMALSISVALQHGVPLQTIVDKLSHTRFEPSGWSKNPGIGFAKSITDYIARFLELRFLKPKQEELIFTPAPSATQVEPIVHVSKGIAQYVDMGDAPACNVCGAMMTRNGSCYRCHECGSTSGCS